MIDLKQKELDVWQAKNFGRHDDDALKCALGMAEEVGEVCHHVLKGTQKIRGGIDGLNKAEIADGVADTLIYGLQLLSVIGVDAEKEIVSVIDKVLARDWKKDPTGSKCDCTEDYGSYSKQGLVYCNNCNRLEVGLMG